MSFAINIIIPYLQIFNTLIAVILNISPIVAFIPVIKGKEKYTNIPILMLIFTLINNLGWSCYWYRVFRYSPMTCSIICSIIASCFFFIYLYFLSKKNIHKFIMYSLILIVINIILFIAPGQNLKKVIRKKNHKLIPIATTIIGCICSAGWLLFGIIVEDINCIIPNGLGLISSIITTFIWIYFFCRTRKMMIRKKMKFYSESDNTTKEVAIQYT